MAQTNFMKEKSLNIKVWIISIIFFSAAIITAMFIAAGML